MNILGIDMGTTTISAVVLDGGTRAVIHSETEPGPGFLAAEPWARVQNADASAGQALALAGRLCAEFGPSRDAARTWPDIPPSNAIVGAYLRLELLLRDGRAEQCLRECRGFFAPMARLTGTLWENLSPEASLDHGFASSAAWLIRRACDATAG